MKKFILFIFIASLSAAQPKLDSLLVSIKGKPDTVAARQLTDLCWEYRSIDPRAAIGYGLAALEILENVSDQHYKSEALNFLGVIYGNLGNLDSAFYYYQKALDVSVAINDSNQIAYSLNNIGDYYFKNALYSTALEKIFEAYKIFESLHNYQGMAYALNDIGEIYLTQEDLDKAFEYFQRSSKIRFDRNDKRGYAKSLINIASVYEKQNKYELALENYYKAYDVSKESGYIKGESWALAGMADLYFQQGKYQKALENRIKALEIDKKIGNKYGEIINYNQMGVIYIHLGELAVAENYLNMARAESRNTGHLDQLMSAYKYLTELSVSKRDYEAAYNYINEYQELKEKIYSQEAQNKIADLQTAFLTERKDRENKLLKKDVEFEKTTRNYLLLITLLILGGVVLFVLKYKSEKRTNQLLKELNSSKDKFFSIIAHDLKNPFGAVSNIADFLKSDYDTLTETERKELIDSIADASLEIQGLLMDLLTWARSQKGEIGVNRTELNLHGLLSSISASYKLAAKNKNINLHVDAGEDLFIQADKFILETVAGNFLNNAIKFSYHNSEIIISGKVKDSFIEISVKDHGKGIDKETLENLFKVESKTTTLGTNNEKGTGLGLKICKEFTELHGGVIEADSEPGIGSKFTLKIPVS